MDSSDLAPDSSVTSVDPELTRPFVESLKLEQSLAHASGDPRWLLLARDERDAHAFSRLARSSAPCAVVAPEWKWVRADVALHPAQYRTLLLEALTPLRDRIRGVVVSRDLAPEVRHFVRVCRELRLLTILLPDRLLAAKTQKPVARPKPPWATPSLYSDPKRHADSPATDYVFAYSRAEQSVFLKLGISAEHLILLGKDIPLMPLHPAPGIRSSRLLRPVHDLLARKTVGPIVKRLEQLKQPEPEAAGAEPQGEADWLFSGQFRTTPRAGVVAYHRSIDASDTHIPVMLGYRRLFSPTSIAEAQEADVFAAWGGAQGEHRKVRLRRWAKRLHRPMLVLEDGLFRSVDIGLKGTPTLSILLDDRSPYYDARRASRLERVLKSDRGFTEEELARATRCMRRIVKSRLSKYNHAPDHPLPFPKGSVLVVDQRYGDLSVSQGMADESDFREMLLAACREHPDSPILIKRHPDALSGGKSSYFSDEVLASLGPLPNVHLIDYEVNPHALFDCCHHVYVVTSGMGFEALLRKRKVHCFGVPFYAGWGLTKDRKKLSRRKRKGLPRRELAELFHVVCILHSRYYHPEKQKPCSIEEALKYLVQARDDRAATMAAKITAKAT